MRENGGAAAMAVTGTWNPVNHYRIDHILVSHALLARVAAASGTVRASDHAPVLARLNY
ncbi:hypothetical protein OG607_05140 [Streptomyces sp. NBC_01537]|uniref:hypothetical protein n=1 Tax=Streptomyces sp. NBC_01537 TaxID=2903896 RepID=UPI0038664A8F